MNGARPALYGKSSIKYKIAVAFFLVIILFGVSLSVITRTTLRRAMIAASIPAEAIGQVTDVFTVVSLGLIMVSIGLTVIIAVYLANYIAGPVKRLTRITEEISAGKLDIGIDPELMATGDEIGDLAGAFDRMLKDLNGVTVSRDELNREIAERVKAERGRRCSPTSSRTRPRPWTGKGRSRSPAAGSRLTAGIGSG